MTFWRTDSTTGVGKRKKEASYVQSPVTVFSSRYCQRELYVGRNLAFEGNRFQLDEACLAKSYNQTVAQRGREANIVNRLLQKRGPSSR